MLTILLLTLAIFGLAVLALAAGSMASGRSHPGSCGAGRGEPHGEEAGSCGSAGQDGEMPGARCGGCRRSH